MDVERTAGVCFAYLATYALHSTLLCALALWVARRAAFVAPRAVERLLRAALIGAVLTASVSFALGFEPIGGRFELAARPSPGPATAASASPSRAVPHAAMPAVLPLAFSPAWSPTPATMQNAPPNAVPSLLAPAAPVELLPSARPAALGPTVEAVPVSAARSTGAQLALEQIAVALWLAGVALGAARAWRDAAALRRALRWRTRLRGGPLVETLAELCAQAGIARPVRLSVAPGASVPLSFGLLRPEIALPPRVLEDLAPEEQRAVLAHELAHVARRDVAWLWLARAIAVVFCFQPLHRWIARELERRAEFAADRWARGQLGSGEPLASALAEIAGWLIEGRRPLLAAPMARERSQLARRVEHLLLGDAPPAEPRAWSAAAPLACAVVAAWAPAFGAAEAPGAAEDAATEPGLAQPHRSIEPWPATGEPDADDARRGEPATDSPAIDDAETSDLANDSPGALLADAAAALDAEIDALQAELDELHDELAAGAPDLAIEAELARLEARVQRLFERRGRLRELFHALTLELDAATAASPEDTARLSTSLEATR